MTEPRDDTIEIETVATVARLARLGLTPEETGAACAELRGLLAHFRAVQDVDPALLASPAGDRGAPHAQPAPDVPVPFEDARARLLALGARTREGLFVVPRVIEEAPPAPGADADPDPAGEE